MLCLAAAAVFAGDAVLIPAGVHVSFFAGKDGSKSGQRTAVAIPAFWMDRYPATKAEFLQFVKANPEWKKSRIKRLYADSHYLADWPDDLHFGKEGSEGQAPVTNVSWFAARGYCQAAGKELPTTDQWEYAADDQGRGTSQDFESYGLPDWTRIPSVRSAALNGYGVSGLRGVIWEWTLDFSDPTQGDSDSDAAFCGAGSQGAANPSDYASFLRYAFRSSLKADYAEGSLGFRCVRAVRP